MPSSECQSQHRNMRVKNPTYRKMSSKTAAVTPSESISRKKKMFRDKMETRQIKARK